MGDPAGSYRHAGSEAEVVSRTREGNAEKAPTCFKQGVHGCPDFVRFS